MSTFDSDPRTLSREAYTYLYPLVTMEFTRRQMTNRPASDDGAYGPANRFSHVREFPAADFRVVVRPNFDTLYSSAWIDLTRGPIQIDLPDSADRYYMLPMLDMWTDVFANPGKRTTGTGAQRIIVTPPGYTGEVPDGSMHIAAPTPHIWVIGRSQTNGPADYKAVRAFQDGWTIRELSGPVEQTIDPSIDMTTEPLHAVDAMSAVDFFCVASELLKIHPPHHSDFSQLHRMSLLGLSAGEDFDPSRFAEDDLAELEAGAEEARTAMAAFVPRLGDRVNGWVVPSNTMGVYGNFYLKRAVVTRIGLGANPAEDAVYPVLLADSEGHALTGQHAYKIHFEADALPPVSGFWSITMYDAEGFQAANELDRFAVGDRDDLTYNPDGSLDILVQHANPGPSLESNWLPAPQGPLGITMRLYAPKAEVLTGDWVPPAVRRIH